MTTKIMQRLAGKVSVLIMVALLIAAVGTYGLSNSKHESTGRATASVSPSKVETAPAANTPVAKNQAAGSVKAAAVNVSVQTAAAQPASSAAPPAAVTAAPAASAAAPATVTASAAAPVTMTPAPASVAKEQTAPLQEARATYAKLPLSFIPNQGQFQKGVDYEARGMAYTASLTAGAAYVGLHTLPVNGQPAKQSLVKIEFAGGNKLRYEAREKQSSYANFIGGKYSGRYERVPNYGRLNAAEIYPGIDTTFYGNQSNLQFDFLVKPGADPKAIQLKIGGGTVKLDENGDLAIATELGTIYQRKPVLYQEANGVRQTVEGSYQVDGDRVSFRVGAYDAQRTLVIDPIINFSLVIGSGTSIGDAQLNAVAIDQGAVYVAGTTTDNTLDLNGGITTISGQRAASPYSDGIVVSFHRDGTLANWSTYLGGSDVDTALGIAIEDMTLNAPTTGGSPTPNYPNSQPGIYVVGQTFSTDFALGNPGPNFPSTDGPYQGNGDGWIIRLTGGGFQSAGPLYLGGPGADTATSVAVRCAGGCTSGTSDDVYVGMTVSTTMAAPAGLNAFGTFTSGVTAGAILDLQANNLASKNVRYINGTQAVTITALTLLPYPVSTPNPPALPALIPATRLAFVGNVTAPGGLNGNAFVKPVQGTATSPYGFAPGASSEGMYGVTNTQLGSNATPLHDLNNLDYVGGSGNPVVRAVSVLPDQNIVVVGDSDTLPFTTVSPLPTTNTTYGTNGLAPTGGARDVVAVIINPAADTATATAIVGTTATGTLIQGTPATLTVTYGQTATIGCNSPPCTPGTGNAAAGVLATGTITAGTRGTLTITPGTPFTVTITGGTQATVTPNYSVTPPYVLDSVTINSGGTGYWAANPPTVNISGGTCTIEPTAIVSSTTGVGLNGTGTIIGVTVTNGGSCTVVPTTFTISAPGVQSITLNAAGSGYESGTGPLTIPFSGTCTTPPAGTATVGAGAPVGAGGANTNASISGITVTSLGAGCSVQPSSAGTNSNIAGSSTVSPGIVSAVVNNAGSGYQGGSTVSATFNGTCGTTPTAQVVIGFPPVPDQSLPASTNILTNSGAGCAATPPTSGGTTVTPPGVATITITAPGGTGYNTTNPPHVTFNGYTCPGGAPTATATVNAVAGNITALTLTNSGVNCTTEPTGITIDYPGITNIPVLQGGTACLPAGSPNASACYSATYPPSLVVAAPTGGGLCDVTATAVPVISSTGIITSIAITNQGCGYSSNPVVTIGGPGIAIGATTPGGQGTGYPTTGLTAALTGAFLTSCSIAPSLGAPIVPAVGSPSAGQITGIPLPPPNGPGSCTNPNTAPVGGPGSYTGDITLSGLPGAVGITQTGAGNSYNMPPTLTFGADCTVNPVITSSLNGAPPTGVLSTGYTVTSFGYNCTGTAVTFTPPGLSAQNPLTVPSTAFTLTSGGSGYVTPPTVTVTGCGTPPAASSALSIPPGAPNTVGSVFLNSPISGGNNCVNPVVTFTGGATTSFVSLNYLGGTGNDFGNAVTTDANSNIYLAGQTCSPNFPVLGASLGAQFTTLQGPCDAYISRISEKTGSVEGINGDNGGGFSTYFGGAGGNSVFSALASDQLLDVFASGQTFSPNFYTTQQPAFSGNSAGALVNLQFNNLLIAPSTTWDFTAGYDGSAPVPAAAAFTVNFANHVVPYSVAGGPLGGAPGTVITYAPNPNVPSPSWLIITPSLNGFTLNVNDAGLPPDNYSATFLISAPGSDTPPITFTVNLTVTATFQTFNCSPTCTPAGNFAFAYAKLQSATVATQNLEVGLVNVSVPPNSYPPNGFTATVSYNTNSAFIQSTATNGVPTAATNANFKWFSVGGADCSGASGCSGEPFGSNIAITLNQSVLDTLWESAPNGVSSAAGTITLTQVNPGGGAITSVVITVTATVTPRVFLSTANSSTLPGIGYAFGCTSAPPNPCTSLQPSVTERILLRAKNDVINIISAGNPNTIAALTIATMPTGGSATCFSGSNGGVNIPAALGPSFLYQLPSTSDAITPDASVPVQININSGNAGCVQGTYTGTLTIAVSGIPTGAVSGGLGTGDTVATTAGFNAIGPPDPPVEIPPVTVPVTIILGNVLQSCSTASAPGTCTPSSFTFPGSGGPLVINSQEGLAAANLITTPAGVPDAPQTSTVSLTLPPSGYNTGYMVKCIANSLGAYVGSTSTSSSTATCGWLSVSINSSTLTGGVSDTLTVSLSAASTSVPTTGGSTATTYTGTVQLIYTSGTLAGNSITYPVTFNVVRQPLSWFTSGPPYTPAPVSVVTTVGAGTVGFVNGSATPTQLTSIPCGSVYSLLPEYASPVAVEMQVAALASQTFPLTTPAVGGSGAPVTAGWLTVTQSGSAGGAGSPDSVTCSINIANMTAGVYSAYIDAVPLPLTVAGDTPPGTPTPASWPLGTPPLTNRTFETLTLTVNPAPTLTVAPTSFDFGYQLGTGGNSGYQTGSGYSGASPASLTLTDNSGVSMQGVYVNPNSLPTWLVLSGPATVAGGVTLAANGGSTTVTLTLTPPVTPGTYNAAITVACNNCAASTSTIPITLTVIGSATITSVPGTLTPFTFQQNGPTPAVQNLVVNLTSGSGNVTLTPASCGTAGATCSGATWLQVNGVAAATASVPINTSGIQFSIGVDPVQLNALLASNTPYLGTITIAVPGATNTPVVLNVSVLVIAQPTLNTSNTGTAFSFTVGNPNTTPVSTSVSVSTATTTGQAASAGFTLTPTSQSNWLLLNGSATAVVANTATINPLTYTITVNPAALTTLEALVPAGSSMNFPGSITIATTPPPAGTVTPTVISYTLTISNQPIINISCPGTSFAYTLTTAAATPASIVCSVTDSSSVVGITGMSISGCPGSWLGCALGATSVAAGGSTTLTLTPTNLANQNPGTFGAADMITVSGSIPPASGGGPAISGSVSAVTITNTPLTTVSPTSLNFSGANGYTQGVLPLPPNQVVTGSLAEGTGGTPAGPGTPGTGTLIATVAPSSFAAGSCALATGATGTPNVTAGPALWLTVNQTVSGTGSAAVYSFNVAVNPAVFPALTAVTTCTGTINVNSTGVTPAAVLKTVTVTFTQNPQPGFTASTAGGTIPQNGAFPTAFTIVNGYPVSLTSTATPVPVTVSSSPTENQAYTVTITPVTGGSWLTTTSTTGSTSASVPGFSLGVNPGANSLAPGGPYYATVAIAAANSSTTTTPLTFTVALNVDATPTLAVGGALGFGTYYTLFTTPGSLSLGVSTASATAGAPITPATFTVTQTAGSLIGSTPATLLVINSGGTQTFTSTGTGTVISVPISFSAAVANTLGLAQSTAVTYGGTVTVAVTQTGVSTIPQTVVVPWSLTIYPESVIQTGPTAAQGVIINCVSGLTCTTTVTVAASSLGNLVNVPVSATPSSEPTPWLAVTAAPATANSTSLTLSANTLGLQASTSYAGQVVVTSADAANSPYTVPVTLNVLPSTCTFTPTSSSASLPSSGTATTSGTIPGGFLPENPLTVSLGTAGNCATGNYAITSSATWLTATPVIGGSFTYTALSNANSTAKSATLTITNTNSASGYFQTFTVTEAGDTVEVVSQREVRALYQSVLFRDPDSTGFLFWTGVGAAGLGQMTDSFLTSPEAFNSDFAVMAAYQAATGGAPSYAQFTAAVPAIKAGTQTITGLFSSLIASNSTYTATTLYQNLLNRLPTTTESSDCTTAGLPACFSTLIGFPSTNGTIIVPANEFQSTCGTSLCSGISGVTHAATGDHTNSLYVTMLYFVILDRDPDLGGLNFWIGIANGGGPGLLFQGATGYPTRIQILGTGVPNQGFTGSPEFLAKFQ